MKQNAKHKTIGILTGRSVYLRPHVAADANARYVSWLNDPQVNRFLEARFSRTTVTRLRSYLRSLKKKQNTVQLAICERKSKRHIGNIKLEDINLNHGFATLGVVIGEKSFWGKGCCAEASRLMLEYAFKRLKLNKVILGVYDNHEQAIKAYRNTGFRVEGRLKGLLMFEGRRTDKLIMAIDRERFKKLKARIL